MWNKHLFMTRDQMRTYDRIAIEEMGIPGPLLMENAGRGAAEAIMARFNASQKVAIMTGPGNNGGDGFVIARHLINHGFDVTTYLAYPKERIQGDAKLNLDILNQMKGKMVEVTAKEALPSIHFFNAYDVLIDALLGTGVTRPITGHFGEIIDLMNAAEAPIVAIDIPSGLDADSGIESGRCIEAAHTVTFGHLKRGLLLHPGSDLAGEIEVVSIGAPAEVSKAAGIDGEVLSESRIRPLLPPRPTTGHKGTFGHLLVLGGLLGKSGAAAMTGTAAMRVGTGLVTCVTTKEAQPILEAKSMETMVDHLATCEADAFTDVEAKRLDALCQGKKAVAVGPGLGQSPLMIEALRHLIDQWDLPMVIDADGLNMVAAHPEMLIGRSKQAVLTPHPGEMARLCNTTTNAVQADRINIARRTAERFNAVVVLKGAHTVIAAPDGALFINPTGNPGMGSGGMGDVLTGIIGGFLAQGCAPQDAACLGVYLHGSAGDEAAEQYGFASLTASDVIQNLATIIKKWA